MGIPSYFRRIIQKYPGIIGNEAPRAAALCFDFNCLIYRCIRGPGMPDGESEGFEDALLREVAKTVKEVWKVAGKPKRVFLAVDGVVPMAKIRQQRVRRFKSASLRVGGWDSNAITPGTEFMDKLTTVLEGILLSGWTLSSVQEAGEGEHKIMSWLSGDCGIGKEDSVIVYGLDADLILLSMIASGGGKKITLMREKQEFGSSPEDSEQEYSFMNLEEFKRRLGLESEHEIINYVALMSLMGNDFLPHSMTHKLNDDGHDCVLSEYRKMKKNGCGWLVIQGKLQKRVLLNICRSWGMEEESRILHTIQKKKDQAERGVLKGMDESEGLPLQWAVEKVLLSGRVLRDDWRSEYWKWIHPYADRDRICAEYIYGCQWILDYYLQKPVNRSWMFPAWIPPLWKDLAKFLEGETVAEAVAVAVAEEPKPIEQLAMVLPLKSWGLIRGEYRVLPVLAPQMWPLDFSYFSAGRKWLWECEALIPILTAARIREILKKGR